MQPRFIKRLQSQSFFTQFANWLTNFPIITFFYLVLITTCAILVLIFKEHLDVLNLRTQFKIVTGMFVAKSLLEFILLVGMISGILYDEEQRGSCRYLLAFPFRHVIVLGIQIGYSYLPGLVPELPSTLTSTPILFCLFIASEQSLNMKVSSVDILKLPLQIKTKLYPIFLIILLELIEYRVDVILVYIAGLLFDFLNLKKLGVFLSKRCHGFCCRCCFKNFIKPPTKLQQYNSPTKKQVDNLATSNSIVIQDQITQL